MNPNDSGGKAATIRPKPVVNVPQKPRQTWRAQRGEPASRDAQRRAATVLEVLAGVRMPLDAAAALGIGLPRYYLLEQRALRGLLAACEPRGPGQTRSDQKQIALLEREVVRLKQECARQQALVRAAQRTIGLAPPAEPKPAAKAAGKVAGKRPRKRRPAVRALKAAAVLRAASSSESDQDSSGASSAQVLQQTVGSCPRLPTVPALPATAAGGG